MKLARPFLLLSLAAATLFATSCASVYNREYDKAVSEYSAGRTKSPEGPWEGTWTTTTNGHTGPLRCIVSEDKKNPGHYDFKYRASWQKIFSGTFKVNYAARRSGSTTLVNGTEDLGLFGKFQHDATIRPGSFKSVYRKVDGEEVGGFQLKRPAR